MRTKGMALMILLGVLASGCAKGIAAPLVYRVCENGTGYREGCATWSITGSEGEVRWDDGSVGKLQITRMDDKDVRIRRTEILGSRVGRRAIYAGQGFGDGEFGGQVYEIEGSGRRLGFWKATPTGVTAPKTGRLPAATNNLARLATYDLCQWGDDDPKRYCARMTIDGNRGRLDFSDNTSADLIVTAFGEEMAFERTVGLGPYAGTKLNYTGKRDSAGNYAGTLAGIVDGERGTWNWTAVARPASVVNRFVPKVPTMKPQSAIKQAAPALKPAAKSGFSAGELAALELFTMILLGEPTSSPKRYRRSPEDCDAACQEDKAAERFRDIIADRERRYAEEH